MTIDHTIFSEKFARFFSTDSSSAKYTNILAATWLHTPLGPMLAIASEEALYLLEFFDRKNLEQEIELLRQRTNSNIVVERTTTINMIENELRHYFNGELKQFITPLFLLGSSFQKRVWEELQKIPSGTTCSYSEIAVAIGQPSAARAVARANSTNQCAIIIPCHRVINANDKLGGYAAGLMRKEWLIKHEKNNRI